MFVLIISGSGWSCVTGKDTAYVVSMGGEREEVVCYI